MNIQIELDEIEIRKIVEERVISEAVEKISEDIVAKWRGREYREIARKAIKESVEKNEKILLDAACQYAGDKIVRDAKKIGLINIKEMMEFGEREGV